jgi:hypothetical protein
MRDMFDSPIRRPPGCILEQELGERKGDDTGKGEDGKRARKGKVALQMRRRKRKTGGTYSSQ